MLPGLLELLLAAEPIGRVRYEKHAICGLVVDTSVRFLVLLPIP